MVKKIILIIIRCILATAILMGAEFILGYELFQKLSFLPYEVKLFGGALFVAIIHMVIQHMLNFIYKVKEKMTVCFAILSLIISNLYYHILINEKQEVISSMVDNKAYSDLWMFLLMVTMWSVLVIIIYIFGCMLYRRYIKKEENILQDYDDKKIILLVVRGILATAIFIGIEFAFSEFVICEMNGVSFGKMLVKGAVGIAILNFVIQHIFNIICKVKENMIVCLAIVALIVSDICWMMLLGNSEVGLFDEIDHSSQIDYFTLAMFALVVTAWSVLVGVVYKIARVIHRKHIEKEKNIIA